MDFSKDLSALNASINDFTKILSNDAQSTFSDAFKQDKYLEKGFYTLSTFSDMKVDDFKILFKAPDATVLVKKRMFSSLDEYNDIQYLDSEEKLFLSASKRLFSNKCKQIASLEQLTKINNYIENGGQSFDLFLPVVIGAVDSLFNATSAISPSSTFLSSLSTVKKYTDQLKEVLYYNSPSKYTTWISENIGTSSNIINNAFAKETGVIELTNFTGFTTTTSIELSGGNASVQFADPYHYCKIYQEDIELALSDVLNSSSGMNPLNSQVFNFTIQQTLGMIQDLTGKLNFHRNQRNASKITFNNYPNSNGKKVVARLETSNQEIYFTSTSIMDAVPSFDDIVIDKRFVKSSNDINDALDDYEANLFKSIIRDYNTYISILNNLQSTKIANNKANSYVRRKLNFNFLGKHIVQPNDIVYIYINSKLKNDTYISNSIKDVLNFSNLESNLQQDVNNLTNTFNGIFNPSSSLNLQIEREIYATPDFPSYLWMMFRNYFIQDRAGTAVFVGLADGAASSYSGEKYTFSFNVKTNKKYFEMGSVILKPGCSSDNNTILDPLTPYKTKFDQTFTNYDNKELILLDDNIKRLGTGILKFKAGPLTGKTATYTNLQSDVTDIQVTENSFITDKTKNSKIIYAPDGLVNKWKEGIGINVQYGNNVNTNPSNSGAVTVYQDPFQGQSALNCISLLVTGKPYDYIKYFQATIKGSTGTIDPYFDFLQSELTKRNLTWGNFKPYKSLNLNEIQTKSLVMKQLTIQQKYNNINDILNKITDLQVLAINTTGSTDPKDPMSSLFYSDFKKLTDQMSVIQKDILNTPNSNGNLILTGNKVNIDVNKNNKDYDKQLRRKTNEYTRRLSWKVRANNDTNLFIVDDMLDKDSDIDIFLKDLANSLDMYSSLPQNVLQKIADVIKTLNIEAFFDSQGHLRIRSPQYNRMPSSVFSKMIKLKQDTGISMFPPFIEDMIKNRIQYLLDKIEVEEDYIRILACLLGKTTDKDVVDLLKFNGTLLFLTSEPVAPNFTSKIMSLSNVLDNIANPDWYLNKFMTDIDTLSKENILSIDNKINAINNFILPKDRDKGIVPVGDSSDTAISIASQKINSLQQNIYNKTGQQFVVDAYITKLSSVILSVTANNAINAVKIINEITNHIDERQILAKQLQSSLKNYKDSISIDTNTNLQAQVMHQKTNNVDIPEIFENIIEDENYDDFGPNSGSRFVIKKEHIKSLSINENEPRFTMVQVNGSIANYSSLSINTGNFYANGGNGMVSAEAVDYDLWRMYGLKECNTIQAPFLHDPKSQCAPFAALLLNQERSNILRGNCTITGNEFMQAGDVVYIEPENMLFYVESVNHSYSWGSFITSLSLGYGHLPGEYIPNPYDIIGKVLYNNQYATDITNFRTMSNNEEVSLGAVANTINITTYSEYSKNLQDILNKILEQSALFLNKSSLGDSDNIIIPRVKLRYYTDSLLNSFTDSPLPLAELIKSFLNGDRSKLYLPNVIDITIPEKDNVPGINKDTVVIEPVDISAKNEKRSPSGSAFSIAESFMSNINYSLEQKDNTFVKDINLRTAEYGKETDRLKIALMKYALDIFIQFETVNISTLKQKESADALSAQEAGMAASDASRAASQQAENQRRNS